MTTREIPTMFWGVAQENSLLTCAKKSMVGTKITPPPNPAILPMNAVVTPIMNIIKKTIERDSLLKR